MKKSTPTTGAPFNHHKDSAFHKENQIIEVKKAFEIRPLRVHGEGEPLIIDLCTKTIV